MSNAIIMAAGTSSRFVPLSQEYPKGLLEVRGEILIERQIRQLKEAGINDITVVVGYKADMFGYLKDKYDLDIVMNEDYCKYNNTSSIIRVLDKLDSTYICCSDHYFHKNVFLDSSTDSYYSALYAEGTTNEYCLETDKDDNIVDVNIGGENSWYMVGHVFFNREFSQEFREIMSVDYAQEETRHGYWEDVYIRHIKELPSLKIHKYCKNEIEEFDTLEELRLFDTTYQNDTRSAILKNIAMKLECQELELREFKNININNGLMFSFEKNTEHYIYDNGRIVKC